MNPKSRKQFKLKFDEIAASGDLQGLLQLHSELGSKLEGNIYVAAREGHWELLKYWHKNVQPLTTGNYVEYAAQGGHFDIMIWLIEMGCKIKSWVLNKTVEFGESDGHLKVIKYLHENANLEFDHSSLDRAAENRHFGIFKYLLDSGLSILDFLIDHCKCNSLFSVENKLIKRRREVVTELEEEAKKIPHSPSLEIQSRTESENSTETLLSSHAPKVPAGARRFLPPIPLATNKLANFQFSDSSDDESEDLALPVSLESKAISSERPVKSPIATNKRPIEDTLTRDPNVSFRQPSSGSRSSALSVNPSVSISYAPNKKACISKDNFDEDLSVTESARENDSKLEMLKYEIKKEEVILKLNLAAVEGKKFDLAKDLLDRGYTLGDIEGFMKNV